MSKKSTIEIHIEATRDDETGVFVAIAKNHPGLIVEAKTLDDLVAEVEMIIPEFISVVSDNKRKSEVRLQFSHNKVLQSIVAA